MKVLVVEPGKEPYVKMLDGSLKSMQEVVGGYIEITHFCSLEGQDLSLVLNEEGRLLGLPRNRNICGIVGNAFICTNNRDELKGLTEEEIEICKKVLALIGITRGRKKTANDIGVS